MPSEVWITVALQITYIISYVVIELWKIKKMQDIPAEKPKQTDVNLSKTVNSTRTTFLSKLHLPLTIPLVIYAIIVVYNLESKGSNIYTVKFTVSIAIMAISHIFVYILLQIILAQNRIILDHGTVLQHVLTRLSTMKVLFSS